MKAYTQYERPVQREEETKGQFNRPLYRTAVIFVSLLIPFVLWVGGAILENLIFPEPIIVLAAMGLFFGVGMGMKFFSKYWL